MSTNYYFRNIEDYENLQFAMREMQPKLTRLEDKLEELKVETSEINGLKQKVNDILEETYPIEVIHIGKRSVGWKPLFQKHEGKFDSVKTMKQWHDDNKDKYEIVDEYDKIMNWEDLKRELIAWENKQNSETQIHPFIGKMYGFFDSEGYEFSYVEFS